MSNMEALDIKKSIVTRDNYAWAFRGIILLVLMIVAAGLWSLLDSHNDSRYVPVKAYSEDAMRSHADIQAINRHLENLDSNREKDHDSLKDIQGDVKSLLNRK